MRGGVGAKLPPIKASKGVKLPQFSITSAHPKKTQVHKGFHKMENACFPAVRWNTLIFFSYWGVGEEWGCSKFKNECFPAEINIRIIPNTSKTMG